MDKKKCVISFSGGETSGYMLWWLLTYKSDEYEFKIVFANTGQENEETLLFVQQCAEYFKVEIIWVEGIHRGKIGTKTVDYINYLDNIFKVKWVNGRIGTKHKIVNYKTATRVNDWRNKPTVFESMIAKYGIPNINSPVCTRELKERPIKSYLRSIGWKDYYLAIGIRQDEFDRMNAKKDEMKIIYPLISDNPMTKPKINTWWNSQPFRLKLKGYQGNCVWCWKKNINKLILLGKENPNNFDFPAYIEKKYKNYISNGVLEAIKKKGKIQLIQVWVYKLTYKTIFFIIIKSFLTKLPLNTKFFRENRTVKDILTATLKKNIIDDSDIYYKDESETCEVFTQCGNK